MAAALPAATGGKVLGAGLGMLGGALFGGSLSTGTPYDSQIQSGAAGLGSLGTNTSTAGTSLLNQGTSLTPQMVSQTQQYINSLNQNPYTNNFMTGQLAGAAGSAANNLAAGQAQLTSQLAARGLAQPGGASSPLAGGLTALQQSSTNTLDSARNQLAGNAYQQMLQNQGMAAQTASGLQGQLIGQGNQTINTGANIQQMSNQDYQSLMNAYVQQQAANASATGGFGTGLGSLLGLIPGL
jgi:hypothetical protein